MKKCTSFDFTNKVVLVTGGASGIGRATALAFAQNGARVAIADWNLAKAEETVALIQSAGGNGICIQTDISESSEVAAMVQSTLRRFGRLDYAFNNAGILGEAKPLAELTPENWQRVIGANLTGVFLSLLHEIPALLKTGGGVIVNNASVLGTVATPGLAPYVAAKHGVIGLTKTAALEYGRQNIRVNAVCPGYVCTPLLDSAGLGTETEAGQSFAAMQALGRFASPEEIAAVVLWLCSDQASFVTGHALLADGGYSAQ